eukprot:gene10317-biopygen13658
MEGRGARPARSPAPPTQPPLPHSFHFTERPRPAGRAERTGDRRDPAPLGLQTAPGGPARPRGAAEEARGAGEHREAEGGLHARRAEPLREDRRHHRNQRAAEEAECGRERAQ